MNRLLPYLKNHNLTAKKLADLCNVSTKTIYNWDKTGIIKNQDKLTLLKNLVPEFKEKELQLYPTDLKPPSIEIERNSDFPKIKIVNKSSRD